MVNYPEPQNRWTLGIASLETKDVIVRKLYSKFQKARVLGVRLTMLSASILIRTGKLWILKDISDHEIEKFLH